MILRIVHEKHERHEKALCLTIIDSWHTSQGYRFAANVKHSTFYIPTTRSIFSCLSCFSWIESFHWTCVASFTHKLPESTTALAGFNGSYHFQGSGIDHRNIAVKPVSHVDMPVILMSADTFGFSAHSNQADFL